MKTTFTLQQFKKRTLSFIVGLVCSSLAYVIYIINPVNMILEYNLQMRPDSFLYTVWKKPPIDIYLNVYVFNITNPVEFQNGKEKLRVQEIGPYVYKEYLENNNVTFNDNGTMSFIPKRTIVFVPELSINNPTQDFVQVANVPLLGVTSALHDAGFLVNYPLTRLANMLDSKPILNMTVYDYLWGYEDSLVALASGIVPNFINFRKFGLLDRQAHLSSSSLVTKKYVCLVDTSQGFLNLFIQRMSSRRQVTRLLMRLADEHFRNSNALLVERNEKTSRLKTRMYIPNGAENYNRLRALTSFHCY